MGPIAAADRGVAAGPGSPTAPGTGDPVAGAAVDVAVDAAVGMAVGMAFDAGVDSVVDSVVEDHACCCERPDCARRFVALAACGDAALRVRLRNRLVEDHLFLARAFANRYRRQGPGFEDIGQVAALAVVEAVNRFDPERGTAFSALAIPTVAGAIKRHFRDTRWVLQTPRRLKELHLQIRTAVEDLTHRLGHAPTAAELADHLDCAEQEILDALQVDDALHPLSIDAPARAADSEAPSLAATLSDTGDPYGHIDDMASVRPLLAQLPARERETVILRYYGNLTQAQIAERVGCSQMHVSRILRSALDRLRAGLVDEGLVGEELAGDGPADPDRPPTRDQRRDQSRDKGWDAGRDAGRDTDRERRPAPPRGRTAPNVHRRPAQSGPAMAGAARAPHTRAVGGRGDPGGEDEPRPLPGTTRPATTRPATTRPATTRPAPPPRPGPGRPPSFGRRAYRVVTRLWSWRHALPYALLPLALAGRRRPPWAQWRLIAQVVPTGDRRDTGPGRGYPRQLHTVSRNRAPPAAGTAGWVEPPHPPRPSWR